MSATCLRCDWEGEASKGVCPTCGAPLYSRPVSRPSASPPESPSPRRSEPVEVGVRMAPASRGSSRSADPDVDGPRGPSEPARRSQPVAALLVISLFLALVVGGWLKAHTPPARPASRSSSLGGTLVYAVDDGPGWSRLWKWSLGTGTVARGPRVPRATQLVDSSTANIGWLGVTSDAGGGVLRASVLRFLGPNDTAAPLVTGDLVSWGPHGENVVALDRGAADGCHRELTIVLVELVPSRREVQFHRPAFCGDVLSVGRDLAATYFTLERDGRATIFYAGYHALHRVLPNHLMLSISPTSDMLVEPISSVSGPSVTSLGGHLAAEPSPSPNAGTSLFFRGLNAPPIPYGDHGARLRVETVLGWSVDSLIALVVGELGNQRGLFEVDGGPGDGLRAPVFIGPIAGATFGTFADDGTAFIETDGRISSFLDGYLNPLALPSGAPAPTGPLAWIP